MKSCKLVAQEDAAEVINLNGSLDCCIELRPDLGTHEDDVGNAEADRD
jgi:hypothetical protein